MPKHLNNGKQKKYCFNSEFAKIIGAITKRGVTDQQLAAFFYENYYDFAKKHDVLGRTALHVGASCGRSKLCHWLITVGCSNINARDLESGYTPLHRALFYGHILTAVRLIQMGADVNLIDKEGLTAIDIVIKDRPKQIKICPNIHCQVYNWGLNDNYTLGIGTNKSRKVPDLLDNFKKKNVSFKQVCIDEFHSVFVSHCSRIWVCGNGQGGRLGVPTDRHILTPRQIGIGGEQCVMAATALNHTLVLLSNGTVLACGQNEHYQLGVSPYIKECLSLKPVSFNKLQHEQLTGICAGKYHSVFYGRQTIFTCGLNGGQLGHAHCENVPFIKTPSQVPVNLKAGSFITHVASSTSCIVFSLSSGDIYILHHFQFKKIASKQLDIIQIATSGGSLQTKIVNESGGVLKVVLLSSGGTIQIWQDSVPYLTRCMFGLSRLISINYIFLNESQILFTTVDGEAFRGTIGQIEKQSVSSLQEEKSGFNKFIEKSECYHIKSCRIHGVHRAVAITSDPKGKNLAVIQVHPHNALMDIPSQNIESMTEQLKQLLDWSTETDPLHDLIFKVQESYFTAHEFIIASNSSTFLSLPKEGKVIEINDVQPVIFKEILYFMYSGWCSLLNEGPVDLRFSNSKDDPVKMLIEACNKYKISSLYKKIVSFKYEEGCITLKEWAEKPSCDHPKFSRTSFADLYDVQVSSEEGEKFGAHKCILAARLDYFHSMLMGGWMETVCTPVLHLQCPSKQVEILLDFLYSNELPESVLTESFENLGRLLILSDQLLFNDLKEFCEVSLVNTLNLKNAATMLQLSFQFNTTQLKQTIMQFISLNLETILESRALEELNDDVLLELEKYHKEFNSSIFNKRIITPYFDFTISDEEIHSCPTVSWPEYVEVNTKDLKDKSQQKTGQTISKKRSTPKKPLIASPEQIISKLPEFYEEKDVDTVILASSPPETEETFFNTCDFPLLDSNYIPTIRSQKSPEVRKVIRPILSQKQRKRLFSLKLEEEKKEVIEPSIPKPRFKGWAIITPPSSNDSSERPENMKFPEVSSFVEIIASEQQEKNNLFKMKAKPFMFTQMEDKAMEDLNKFYNASNIFEERITVHRVVACSVAKPTWIKTNKTLFQ